MLSSKGRYAARILVFMALQPPGAPIRKQCIAEAEQISEDYIEQILLRLKQHRLVNSIRGAGGGFLLNVKPSEITIQQVIEAVEGPVVVAGCCGLDCERAPDCVTRAVWQAATDAVESVLGNVTVQSLADKVIEKRQRRTLFYDI